MRFVAKITFLLFIFASFQTARAEWLKQNVNTFAWLRTIHFADANNGWIGGSRGTFLKTEDGGAHWKQIQKFTDDTIREVYFSDKNTGWLLCERDVFNLGTKSPSYLMKTNDGGVNWDRIEFENKQRRRITKIFFAKNGFGLAIGETGTIFGLKDDNVTWAKLASPSSYLMLDGVFTDNLHGTIVGGGGTILFTEDAGASWNQAFISGDAKSKLNSVFFINDRNGWAAGSQGMVYQTVNGGRFWRLQKTNIEENLNDIYFASTAEGWAIGDNGTILHSTTAGNVWRTEEMRSKHKLEKIFFIGKKGWIVGFGGTLLSYEIGSESDSNRPKFRTR
jgi:photosystem II stability/assembly factor-like uncharacterized protein